MATYHRYLLIAAIVYVILTGYLGVWHFCTLQQDLCVAGAVRTCNLDSYSQLLVALMALLVYIAVFFLLYYMPSSVFIASAYIAIVIVDIFITAKLINNDNVYGGLVLALWASVIIMGTQLLNYKCHSAASVSAIFIAIIFFLFTSLFSSPIPQLKNLPATERNEGSSLERYACNGLNGNHQLDGSTVKLINSEQKKAVDEIKERSKVNDDWFHNKFVLVGGLLAALLIHITWLRTGTIKSAVRDLEELFKNTIIPASVLGMACVVSLAIDIHIGSNQMIIQQVANWIKNCVEQFLNKDPGYYVAWETFLRISNKDNEIHGMHMDTLFNVFNASHFYLGSILLYVMYISCLFVCFSESRRPHEWTASVFIFCLVHVTLAMFVVGANSYPSAFRVQLAVWPNRDFDGRAAGVIPFCICVLVAFLTFTRFLTLYRHHSGRTGGNNFGQLKQKRVKVWRYLQWRRVRPWGGNKNYTAGSVYKKKKEAR